VLLRRWPVSLAMTRLEREAFLAGTHVGIVAVEDPDHAPLTVPVWYSYERGGTVRFITGRSSVKADLIGRAGRISLIVQTEEAPYKYVAVEGPATIGGAPDETERRALARRYLGDELGDAYVEGTAGQDDVTVDVSPEIWRTTDFSKMFA
jgi:PPOX class probable F420-dependent enzyme